MWGLGNGRCLTKKKQSMNPKIVVVGSLNMDLIGRTPHIPQLMMLAKTVFSSFLAQIGR